MITKRLATLLVLLLMFVGCASDGADMQDISAAQSNISSSNTSEELLVEQNDNEIEALKRELEALKNENLKLKEQSQNFKEEKALFSYKGDETEIQSVIYNGTAYVDFKSFLAFINKGLTYSNSEGKFYIKDASSKSSNSVQNKSKDITVYATKTGSKYHIGSCRYLSRSKIPISLSSAKAQGYTPCSVCGPPR